MSGGNMAAGDNFQRCDDASREQRASDDMSDARQEALRYESTFGSLCAINLTC
jgi:hypothetical protein